MAGCGLERLGGGGQICRKFRRLGTQLAKDSDLSEPIIARILSGERKPDINTLIRLARGLDMTLDALLGLELPSSKIESEPTITRTFTRRIRKK